MSRITNFVNMNAVAVKAKEQGQKSSPGFQDILSQKMQLASGTEDTTDLESVFRRAAEKYQVPLSLLKAVAKAESDFNVKAVSRCGAQGVMQLMPETASALGVSDAFDAEQNIFGGAKYLAQKLEQYGGDINLTLAAYNAGSGNVKKYGGVPPFKETRNYIDKVTSYMEDTWDGSEYQNAQLRRDISLQTGGSVDSLEQISYMEVLKAMMRIDILSHELGSLAETGDLDDGA